MTYYLSDGTTNGISGHFLFPIMCPQSLSSKECPLYNQDKNTILIKYICCNQFDINKIYNNLLEKIKDKLNNKVYELYKNNANIGKGILIRHNNILDILLSIIGNNKLLLDDENNFIPCDLLDIDKYLSCYNNVVLNNINDAYDKHYKKYNESDKYKSKYSSVEKYLERVLIYYKSPYRIEMIEFFKNLKLELSKLLINNMIIEDNFKNLRDLEVLTFDEFNKMEPICINGKISNIAQTNYTNYSDISNDLHKDINILLKKVSDDNFIKNIIYKFSVNYDSRLELLFRKYNINCKSDIDVKKGGYFNKYLKYKNKYLNYKNYY